MRIFTLSLSLLFLFSTNTAFALPEPGQDLPFLQRYPGSVMKEYATRQYDEVRMPLGPFKKGEHGAALTQYQSLAGQVVYIDYETPKDRSALEVLSNYRQTLEGEGFRVLWECGNATCRADHDAVGETAGVTNIVWRGGSNQLGSFFPSQDGRMLTARLDSSNGAQTWVYLWIEGPGYRGETQIYAVQTKPMQTGLVHGSSELLTAAAMGQALGQEGRFAMHLPFDFNQATLRPDAMAQVRQLAQALQSHPNWRIGLDGHTDAVGGAAFNQRLSEERAAAVKTALVSLGVPAAQVATRGLGATQPVASNATEEGRVQNRRVEVVNLTPGFVPTLAPSAPQGNPTMGATQAPAMTSSGQQSVPGGGQGQTANVPEPIKDAARTAGDAARSELHYQIYRGVSDLVGGLFH